MSADLTWAECVNLVSWKVEETVRLKLSYPRASPEPG